MKKHFFPALLAFFISALSVTAGFALDPACDPQVNDMQKNQADAVRARDDAYAKQVITQPDSTLGLTCFDQSMAVTSELGRFFSDKVIAPPTAAPGSMSSLLGGAMSSLIGGASLNSLMNQVISSATNPLNSAINQAAGSVTNPLNSAMNQLNGAISQVNGMVNQLNGAISGATNGCVTNPLDIPVISIGNPLASLNGSVNAARTTLGQNLKTVVSPTLNQELSNFPNALSAAMGALTSLFNSQISSALSSLFGAAPGGGAAPGICPSAPVQPTCTRMETVWSGNNPASGVTSVTGSGVTQGIPYTTMQDLFSGSPPGAGSSFTAALGSATSSAALQAAMKDLTTLNAPGGMGSWPAPPVLPAGASTAQIISGM